MLKKCCQLVAITVSLVLTSSATAFASEAPLEKLAKYRAENQHKIVLIDQEIQNLMQGSREDQSIESIEPEILALKKLRDEDVLRGELFDQLAFYIESKYKGKDLQKFLADQLFNMSVIEAKQPQPSPLWKSYLALSKGLLRLAKNDEDPVDFIYSYAINESLTNPQDSESFISSRNFSNGTQFATGHGLSRENVGLILEKRLQLKEQMQPNAGPDLTPPPSSVVVTVTEKMVEIKKSEEEKEITTLKTSPSDAPADTGVEVKIPEKLKIKEY